MASLCCYIELCLFFSDTQGHGVLELSLFGLKLSMSLTRNTSVAWLEAFNVLHHGRDRVLRFLIPSSLALSQILANHILKQTSVYSVIAERLSIWTLSIGRPLRCLIILRFRLMFYGAMLVQIGQAVLTPVSNLLVSFSC
jgi:hypothetical protein